jgi:hypothetical protein
MLNTKYVLMLVVLSGGILTALTGTGMSQTQTAFADKERVCEDNNNRNCNDQKQKVDQENKCKIENENENKDRSDDNENHIDTSQQEFNCWNDAQNAGRDADARDNAFSGGLEAGG